MEQIVAELNIRHELNEPLGPKTWYSVGGPARVLAHPSSVQQLSALAAKCHDKNIPMKVLGSGANLLVADKGVDAIVVQLDEPHFKRMQIEKTLVTAGSGYDLMQLVRETAKTGLSGLEKLAGIPASVGGAVRMNAGGAFGEIGPTIHRVQVMDGTGHVYYRDRDDLIFGYRKSNIVAPFILEVEFDLSPDDPDELMKQVKEVFIYKKSTQPLSANSAGCAFKNPKPPKGVENYNPNYEIPAGKLIDMAGLKGHKIGGAQVSELHGNFIMADADTTAGDILELLQHVQQTVLEKFGVRLEREVVVWE